MSQSRYQPVSKEDAFAAIPDQQDIPIDVSMFPFQFTRRWFSQRNQKTWSSFLLPQYPPSRPYNMIQIGVFEGMDLIWCLQNILTHPNSRVLAVDPWLPTRKITAEQMQETYERAVHNLKPWRGQVQIERNTSFRALSKILQMHHLRIPYVLQNIPIRVKQWDLVVIDGDHNAPAVLDDAVMAYELLKPGGWMVFDDVRNRTRKKHHVQEGIELFLQDYEGCVKRVWAHRFCDCFEKVE